MSSLRLSSWRSAADYWVLISS